MSHRQKSYGLSVKDETTGKRQRTCHTYPSLHSIRMSPCQSHTGKGWSDDSHNDNTGLAPGTGDHPHVARTTIIIDLGHSVLGRSPEDAQDFHQKIRNPRHRK